MSCHKIFRLNVKHAPVRAHTVVGEDANARFGTKTATADSSLIDDNTKKYT
jgi:hypothetical protein